MKFLSVATLVVLASVASAKTLPEKFYGTFDLEADKSVNFDEYLTAKGYGWFTRQLVKYATFKKEFKKSASGTTFDYSNLTSKKDVHYTNIVLGKTFVGDGLDSTKHEITFDLVDNVLFEKHHPIEGGEAKDETYEYTFDGDYLVVGMEANGVRAKRYYKRISQ